MPRSAPLTRLPPRIALDVDAELAAYLIGELARHWPQARVGRAGNVRVADLWVVDCEPSGTVLRPTLWLGAIDGSEALTCLAPGYWHAAMPTTATRLKHTLEACLRELPQAPQRPCASDAPSSATSGDLL
ncbi:MAG: hypothetical protein IT479_06900 [Xanthomonadales bacterium]|nr:hypothetical protein [Xanthomonadales bacterium]MCC6592989.1 hypothetical protein [Xanthomonadales bacterium]